MKKLIFYRILSVALLAISLSLSMMWYGSHQEAVRLKEQMAQENLNNWSDLLLMTQKIQNNVKTVEDVQDFAFYQNTVLCLTARELSPAFNGEGPTRNFSFLTTRYDPLIQDLAVNNIPENAQQEGLELYRAMTADLQSICRYVAEISEASDKTKYDLLNTNSDASKQVGEKIQDFCRTYDSKLLGFYAKIDQKSTT